MPSEGSLPKTSCGILHMDAQGNPIPCPVDAEPEGSASSSPDDHQCCPHFDSAVNADVCCVCGTRESLDAAEPDAAQEAAMDELIHLRQEMEATGPEAPECSHESWEVMGEVKKLSGWLKYRRCADCRESLPDIIEAEPHWDIRPAPPEPEALPPRRPPYAVAYSLEDGTDFEVALSGDATIRAVDGALIITHTSPVKGLTQARPMEGA